MYDVVVVGGGHAGIEAAAAAARMNQKTLLITNKLDMLGSMPCNPSVGGPAKGIVVREIDAFGGLMPQAADQTALQFKMLNTGKGPGVRCLRVQSDKDEYKKWMLNALQKQKNLDLLEQRAAKIILDDSKKKVIGIECEDGCQIHAKMTILTAGTGMNSAILRGHTSTVSGADGLPTNTTLSQSLADAGLKLIRLKTGTPPRVLKSTVDLEPAQIQPGNPEFLHFSELTKPEQVIAPEKQLPCYLIYTQAKTHQIINEHLQDSAMYSGLVTGVGPRYCPSIEDKLVRFADRERHQLFLEPERASYDTFYIQGFSTSMPEEVQEEMVHSLPGLEHAEILKYAYAIEYDAVDPLQMYPSLENKLIENLFTAGQVNGTSGYEEAAAQGLMAGINASLKIQGKEPVVLGRAQAYIGVMIDDLTTKGTKEPYRLLTSRAEYRLLLRHDNAYRRLANIAHDIGVLPEENWQYFLKSEAEFAQTVQALQDTHLKPNEQVNGLLESLGAGNMEHGMDAYTLLKRPNVTIATLAPLTGVMPSVDVANQIEIECKYAGYIEKAKRDVHRLEKLENVRIPKGTDFQAMSNLALEARSKLAQIQPTTLGQASRISGINPSDIAVLSAILQANEK
ncbi:tRNA uridine-5-carboxymethylaminomethyl(34) synthesis enzyme MnmG [Allobaculum stercoricanis]|uniref:tRNA uridine-5-carboxymethylaminomethyl(34) synthesis enzyme MnmG n=1 Tax=Allobaculum stercoricanis TaxID=174709 RepID=UPI0023F19FBA|nr:tRNA uridine-5-carboxymethylaminomethyl(34) synthesis enzyme MnmG [Allobaculum stercoricanis]